MGWRQVLGVDMSLASLRLAEGFRSSHGLDRVQFAQMNLFHAALAPESFDVVICHGVLHSTPAPRSGLEALLRLLRPGGHVVLGLYNRFGRKPTRLRRALIGLGGDRLAWIDPFLRGPDWSEARRRAWLRDQYRHPLESSHTFDEVLGWLDASGIVFVRGIPAFAPGTDPLEGPTLFASDGRGSRFDRLVAQLGLIATGHREGGYFVVIGRKPDARTSERLASPAPASTLGPRRSSHLRRYLGLVTSPLQRLSSLAFLAVVYYLVLTPIAFGRRLVDLLGASGRGSRLEPGWTTRQARNEVASHFLRF